jgi:hypothetical protein
MDIGVGTRLCAFLERPSRGRLPTERAVNPVRDDKSKGRTRSKVRKKQQVGYV